MLSPYTSIIMHYVNENYFNEKQCRMVLYLTCNHVGAKHSMNSLPLQPEETQELHTRIMACLKQ